MPIDPRVFGYIVRVQPVVVNHSLLTALCTQTVATDSENDEEFAASPLATHDHSRFPRADLRIGQPNAKPSVATRLLPCHHQHALCYGITLYRPHSPVNSFQIF